MKRMKVNFSSVREETNAKILIKELKIGEKSGMVINFDRAGNLKLLHGKYNGNLTNKI